MLALCLLMMACQDPPAGTAAPAPPTPVARPDADRPVLVLPIACRIGVDCEIQNHVDRDPGPGASDHQCGSLTYDAHSGVDFRLRDMVALEAGVSVLAAAGGTVARVRDGVADVSVRAAGAPSVEGTECGNGIVVDHGAGWTTQYCHLRRDSVAVAPGDPVRPGQSIAQVGLSGQTEYAHLHLTVRHDGNVIDPFAPGSGTGETCGTGPGLWEPEAAASLIYKPGAVLNTGFAGAPVDLAEVESGTLAERPGRTTALVAYVRAIGLKLGDVQRLRVTGPDGVTVVETVADPLPRHQAQRLLFAGKRPAAGGWPAGRYSAHYEVRRDGGVVLERRFKIVL